MVRVQAFLPYDADEPLGHPGLPESQEGSPVSVLASVSPSCFLPFTPPSHLITPNLCSGPGISFIPREVGEHLVSIKKNGNHVANSPVSIMVVQSEIGDARRAKVYGRGLSEGRTFEMSDFIVDTRDAGLWGVVPGEEAGALELASSCSRYSIFSSCQPSFLCEHPSSNRPFYMIII